MAKQYWLMKSEPDVFSIDDLHTRPDQSEPWDGVRNYQVRNFMRDEMKPGDGVLFYHSNTKPPGVVGVAEITSRAFPDETAFDPDSRYYDPKSDRENPRWLAVTVRFVEKFARTVTLDELKAEPRLGELAVVRKGNRLSVCPVSREHFNLIRKMAKG